MAELSDREKKLLAELEAEQERAEKETPTPEIKIPSDKMALPLGIEEQLEDADSTT